MLKYWQSKLHQSQTNSMNISVTVRVEKFYVNIYYASYKMHTNIGHYRREHKGQGGNKEFK